MFELPPPKPHAVQISVTMPPELAERIKNLAQRLGRKQADVCRALMLPALDAAEKEQA